MPTLSLEVPADVLAALAERATREGSEVDELALDALRGKVLEPPRTAQREPGNVFLTEEESAPFVIPHPPGVPVVPVFKGEYQPDFSSLIKELKEQEEATK
ncbi:MAG: hypothetical protein K2W96_05500 [Gemmataceae bacterium]|nr:hypothetical protein [Gemmataceae bacterium]